MGFSPNNAASSNVLTFSGAAEKVRYRTFQLKAEDSIGLTVIDCARLALLDKVKERLEQVVAKGRKIPPAPLKLILQAEFCPITERRMISGANVPWNTTVSRSAYPPP